MAIARVSWSAFADSVSGTDGEDGFEQALGALIGQRAIADAGLSDRCQVVSGDLFHSVPVGADACRLSRVIHDWDDGKAIEILKTVRAALPAKGRLLLFKTMVRDCSRFSYPLLSDLDMIIRTEGCERTERQYRALYAAAGFKLTRVIPTPSPTRRRIIEGKPAGDGLQSSVSKRQPCMGAKVRNGRKAATEGAL